MFGADIILNGDGDTGEGEGFGRIDGGGKRLSVRDVESEKGLEVGFDRLEVREC